MTQTENAQRIQALKQAGFSVTLRFVGTEERYVGMYKPKSQVLPGLHATEAEAWQAIDAIVSWKRKPLVCPHCGGAEIQQSGGWRAVAENDENNTVMLAEYQCQAACQGRSFWA